MKKIVFFLLVAALMVPAFSSADTIDELRAKVAELVRQLQELQAKLKAAEQEGREWCHTFNTNLGVGAKGSEVTALHAVLQKEGFSIEAHTLAGRVSDYGSFDESTASAVTGFQQKYRDEILKPVGLSYGTGFAGPSTRRKLNALYRCGAESSVFTQEEAVMKSRDARRIADIKQLRLALELYWDAKNSYPVQLAVLAPAYIPTIPTDPLGGIYYYLALPYGCTGDAASKCTGYHIGSSLELNTNPALISDADYNSTAYPGGINGSDQTSCRPLSAVTRYCFDAKEYGVGNIAPPPPPVIPPPAASTAIRILSPNGGERWNFNEQKEITWQTTDQSVRSFAIELFSANGAKSWRILGSTDQTSYAWTVGSVLCSGAVGTCSATLEPGPYFIRVRGQRLGDPEGSYLAYDDSDAPFSVSGTFPGLTSIRVISPNGGESFKVGATIPVSWEALPTANADVWLYLYKNLTSDDTTGKQAVFATLAHGGSSYSWSIPAALEQGNNYRIEVRGTGTFFEVKDISNAAFSIVSDQPDLIVESITASPASILPGSSATLTVTISNQGGAAASGFEVGTGTTFPLLFDIPNSTCEATLAAGAKCVKKYTFTAPAAGTHAVNASVDIGNKIAESSESNNYKTEYITVATP